MQWKSFDFFDVKQADLPDDEAQHLFESNDVSSVCAGSENLFLGGGDGSVSAVAKNWKVVNTFQAHDAGRVTHLCQVEGTSILVTVAVRAAQ